MFTPLIAGSGLSGYQLLRNSKEEQLERLQQDSAVAREIDYFKDNISKVRSADELVQDRRLLEVALTAHGLQDEIDKTAFIKRVLEEGTTDQNAFANQLSQSNWVTFSEAFSFEKVDAGFEKSSFAAAVELAFQPLLTEEPPIDPLILEAGRIGLQDITSIDDLLADENTLNVALAAFGLERGYYNDTHFQMLIEEGIEDPNSYANSLSDTRWADFASAFKGLETGGSMETASLLALKAETAYIAADQIYDLDGEDVAEGAISQAERVAFREAAASISTVEELLADETTKSVLLRSFGLDPDSMSNEDLQPMLEQAVAGDLSLAQAQTDTTWAVMAEAVAEGLGTQISTMEFEIEFGIARYALDKEPEPVQTPEVSDEDLAYFKANIGRDLTIDALLDDEKLLSVALTAFGLEETEASQAFIRSVLEADPYDDSSFLHSLSNDGWAALSKAFNPPESEQISSALMQYALEEKLIAIGAPAEDLDYLRRNFNDADSALDFVLDEALMDIAMSAFGIEKGQYGASFFLKAILSDPNDEKSFVNILGDERFIELSKTIGSFAGGGGRTGLESFAEEMIEGYLEQSFEIAVGNQDQNLRMALYFERTIGDIANGNSVATAGWYQIMGSEPLRQVVDASFGLPDEFAQLDVAKQREIYSERASARYNGATDPSFLNNSDHVTDVLTRFLLSSNTATDLSAVPGYSAIQMIQQTASLMRSYNSA